MPSSFLYTYGVFYELYVRIVCLVSLVHGVVSTDLQAVYAYDISIYLLVERFTPHCTYLFVRLFASETFI